MGRRLVRSFIGRWLDGQLITGPDSEQRAALVDQLARQGWNIRPDDSVLVAAEPVRGIPVCASFLREARLHPLIEPHGDNYVNQHDSPLFGIDLPLTASSNVLPNIALD